MRQVVENATDRQQFEDQTQEPHTDH
jgi:hypothetical protein